MELEAVRIGPDQYVVRDAETGEHLTFLLEERQARMLALAQRAVMLCRDLAALCPNPAPYTLAAQAEAIAQEAGVAPRRMWLFPANEGVTMIGGEDEADSG